MFGRIVWLVGWCVGSFAKQLHVTNPHANHPNFVVARGLGSINIPSAFSEMVKLLSVLLMYTCLQEIQSSLEELYAGTGLGDAEGTVKPTLE